MNLTEEVRLMVDRFIKYKFTYITSNGRSEIVDGSKYRIINDLIDVYPTTFNFKHDESYYLYTTPDVGFYVSFMDQSKENFIRMAVSGEIPNFNV